MRTFFVGLGGDKASKLINYFMSKGISACKDNKQTNRTNTNVQITDVESSSPLSDVIIEIDGKNVVDEKYDGNLQVPSGTHNVVVRKEGYNSTSKKDVDVNKDNEYVWNIGLVPNNPHNNSNFIHIWMIAFMLVGPIFWAGLRYAGLLGFSTTLDVNYLHVSLMADLVIIFGAFLGVLLIGQFLKTSIKNKSITEHSKTIGIFVGSVASVLLLILLMNYSSPTLGRYISSIDILLITFLAIILGIVGMVSGFTFNNAMGDKWNLPQLTPLIGAGIGGLFGYGLASFIISKYSGIDILTTKLGINISFPFHPIIIALSAIIIGYMISVILGTYLKKESSNILGGLSAWGAAVATSILLMILFRISSPLIIITFVGLTALGSFIGFIIIYFMSKHSASEPKFDISEIKACSKSCSKGEYKYPGMCVVADTAENTLKNVTCIKNGSQVFIDLSNSRWDKDYNKILSAETERLKRKVKTIFNRIIENCIGYPDLFVVVVDLRNNDLCTIVPTIIEFLKSEYRLPVYFICLTSPDKVSTNFIKQVGYSCDAVFPVSYDLFEGVVNLGTKCVEVDGEAIEEDIWEERAVDEVLRRFGPILEIGNRHSPTGIDTSHVLRLVNPLNIGKLCCDDNRLMKNKNISDTQDKINWCTIGYTRVDMERCEELNFEIELSNLLIHTFHDLLWEFETNKSTVRTLFIIRGPGKYLKTHLARDMITKLFDGVITMVSDLVVDDSPYLEIIGLFANIPYTLPNRDSEDCSETTTTTITPVDDDDDWDKVIPPIIEPTDVSDKDRWPATEQGYADFCAKYGYTPLIKHIAQKIMERNKDTDWKKVKAVFEFVRDSITYKSDWESQGVDNFVQSPEETLDLGTGDCEDFAILIGAILINMNMDVNLIFVPNHVYPAVYMPDVPNNYRTYKPSPKSDGTNLSDWVGMEATGKNNKFGWLADMDYKVENVCKIPRRK